MLWHGKNLVAVSIVRLVPDVLVEELDDTGVGLDAVLQFRDAVALVFEDQLADGDALLGRAVGYLFGLADGDRNSW